MHGAILTIASLGCIGAFQETEKKPEDREKHWEREPRKRRGAVDRVAGQKQEQPRTETPPEKEMKSKEWPDALAAAVVPILIIEVWLRGGTSG